MGRIEEEERMRAAARNAVMLLKKHGTQSAAARAAGLARKTFTHHLEFATRQGIYSEIMAVNPPTEPISEIAQTRPKFIPQMAYAKGENLRLVSTKDNRFLFGACGDQHVGSKHYREDVANDLYDRYERAGVQAVFNTGNWIDGEASFNRHDIVAHGIDEQARLLAKVYPEAHGVQTYAIWGADHEGWYANREGIDVGSYVEGVMRREGRDDWHNLGFMEAHVDLVNANTGKVAKLAVVHPGGGSAYAISYRPQKILECVPLDSEILTKNGWKLHDEVQVGESVLGYSVEADRCEWTTVTKINRGVGDVVRYWNDQFDVRCTPNHRWAIEWESRAGPNPNSVEPKQYSRRDRLLTTIAESKERSRIIQAALAPDGPGMPQIAHQEWLHRTPLAITRVLKMTSGERRAFIEAMLLGEGTIPNKSDYRTIIFSQRPGPVNDAFRLACFLEGIATTDREAPAGSLKPDSLPTRRVTMLNKRMRICNRLKQEDLGEQEVWCPTTGLGTWVMRQGDLITITGNSYEGGEKPHIILFGHYHKLDAGLIRNCWYGQTGTCQDQTVFMRQKSIEAHVGGMMIQAEQDPETGAILGYTPTLWRYFNRGYYSNRWSKHGPVTQPVRTIGGL
jgi:hypothetical protein